MSWELTLRHVVVACALRWPDSVLGLVACYRVARTAQLDLLKVEVIVDNYVVDSR